VSVAGQRALLWAAVVLLAILTIWLLSPILLPFVAGLAIAYFLDPTVDRLEEHRVPRWLGSVVVLILFLLVVVLFFLLLVPLLQGQVLGLIRRIPAYLDMAQRRLDQVVHYAHEQLSPEDFERVRAAITERVSLVFGWTAGLLQSAVTSSFAIVNILSLVFITPIVAFFMLRDWDAMVRKVDSWLPRPNAPTIRALARRVDETLAGFVRGQATVCLALGVYYAAALSLVGLEFGLVVGALIGILTFIPFVGAMIGAVLSIGLAMTQFDTWGRVLVIGGIFIAGQMIEGNVLTPKLVGDRVNLHPVWVMFAVLAFGALFGFVGVLIAVPVAAVIGVLVRYALARYLESDLYDPRPS
jgi:predicted PurR-regulated permease PerM